MIQQTFLGIRQIFHFQGIPNPLSSRRFPCRIQKKRMPAPEFRSGHALKGVRVGLRRKVRSRT